MSNANKTFRMNNQVNSIPSNADSVVKEWAQNNRVAAETIRNFLLNGLNGGVFVVKKQKESGNHEETENLRLYKIRGRIDRN